MPNHSELYDIYNKYLKTINFGKTPNKLYDPIYYSLEVGGKRIRPILCLMATEMFGGNYQSALDVAIGIEIFHNFTLLHDDMMDKAEVRRGKPVVHVKWDENIALLSGDAMSIIAYKYINKASTNQSEIIDLFSDTALKICEGQQYDMNFETETLIREQDYLEMINLKTAVFLAASLKIGAILANAPAEDAQKLYDFGINIGMAFQLQDDMLDVFGNFEKFGKKIGGDITTNKKTYLLIKALDLANDKQKTELLSWFSNTNFDVNQKINSVKSIYGDLNIESHSTTLMNKYFDTAYKILDSIKLSPDAKKNLIDYTNVLKGRDY